MRSLKKCFILLASCVIMCCITGMTRPLTQVEDWAEKWKIAVMENLQLKETISTLRLQIADYRLQTKNDKIALEPMRYFRRVNDIDYNNPYQFDVDHYRRLLSYIDKYEYLLSAEARESAKRDKINIRHFMLAWPAKESHYNPLAKHLCKNGTWDRTLYQLNDVVWDLCYKQIPEALKKIPDPKNNTEVATAMMYIWINERVKMNWSWALLSYKTDKGIWQHWAWTLYWYIGEIEKNG